MAYIINLSDHLISRILSGAAGGIVRREAPRPRGSDRRVYFYAGKKGGSHRIIGCARCCRWHLRRCLEEWTDEDLDLLDRDRPEYTTVEDWREAGRLCIWTEYGRETPLYLWTFADLVTFPEDIRPRLLSGRMGSWGRWTEKVAARFDRLPPPTAADRKKTAKRLPPPPPPVL